jgi:tetratricopeptide (TPR) repeat protein
MAVATTLGACEDISPVVSKPQSPVSAVAPDPEAIPPPPPVAGPTPPPSVVSDARQPEVATKDPSADNPEADAKPVEALEGARRMLEAGEHDKALKLAKVAVLKTPKRSAAWNTLGRAQLRMGKRSDAITSFEKAVELNPRSSYAQNNLGLALIYDKRYDEAVDALEEAVELEPVEGYMWNNLGMAYEQLDRLEEARDAYGNAVEMDNDRARDSLARLKGVETVIRTAKVETDTKVRPRKKDDKEEPTKSQ